MRSEIIRVYKAVHTWTGILCGLALFIAFYAGAITIFKEPLARWVAPPSQGTSAVPLEKAPLLITSLLAQQPQTTQDFRLYLEDTENLPARVGWQVKSAGADEHDSASARRYIATLDAQDSAHIEEIHSTQIAEFIDVLHRVVGLPVDNDPNRWFMGAVSALYALALVSGVIVLIPTLIKDLFAIRIGKNLKRMWLDAHNVVGLLSLPFHVTMAITAVVFAFHDGIYDVQDVLFHEGRLNNLFQAARAQRGDPAPQRDPSTMLPPSDLLTKVHAIAPEFEPTMMQYLGVTGKRPVVRVWGRDARAIAPRAMGGFAAVDPYSGKVMSTDFLPGRQDTTNTVISSFFALHMATFGGSTVQWLYFLLGLAGAWLFYSGNLLWIESRRKRAQRGNALLPEQRRDVRYLASLTIGVCLGCISGISLTIVAGKWLHGHVEDINAWHHGVYYSSFFVCIVWAFWRGAAHAVVEQLRFAAMTTALIPLTTVLAWCVPSLGLWGYTSPASLGVDSIALAGVLGFAWMAHAARKRRERGPLDSIWALRSKSSAEHAAPE